MRNAFVTRLLGLAMVVAVAAGSGCASNHYSKGGGYVNVQQFANVEADLEMGKPVKETVEIKRFLGFITVGMPTHFAEGIVYVQPGSPMGSDGGLFGPGLVELAKSAAAYKAIEKDGYDMLLGARYHVEINDNLIAISVKATVMGQGAKVKKFQQVH